MTVNTSALDGWDKLQMKLEAVTKRHMHQGRYECRGKNTVVPGNEDGRQIKKTKPLGDFLDAAL